MMIKLHVSKELALPVEVAGEAIGILATRGAGKSYTSAAFVEELWDAGIQVAVVDPTGVYWGLRASSGSHRGLPIIVLGGAHGDAPLEPTAGALIADVLVDTGQSLILDFSDFGTKSEQTKFVTAFAERLYTRKARNRTTLHLVIDEADEFAPQKPMPGEQVMLGSMERLVRRGRSRGIGVTLITQRSAALNKNVLDVVDTLLAMRMPGPRDRAAVASWITAKSESDELGVLDSLPGLPTGTAWVWSPVRRLLQKVPMRRIRTFDSYATPKPGQVRAEPKHLAEIDVQKLGQQIAATKERAKAEDPRELNKKIHDLETQLRKERSNILQVAEPVIQTVDVPVLKPEQITELKALIVKSLAFEESLQALGTSIRESAETIAKEIAKVRSAPAIDLTQRPVPAARPLARPIARSNQAAPSSFQGFTPSKKQQQILDAIAWFESIGIPSPSGLQIGAVALIDASGGHFSNTVGPLSANGLIERGGGFISLTDAGRSLAQAPDNVGTLREYHDVLRQRVRRIRRAGRKTIEMMDAIIAGHGKNLTAEEIGQTVGIDHTGGHFSNTIGPLSTIGLIERRSGLVRPTEILFPPGIR